MQIILRKFTKLLITSFIIILLTAFSALDYTRKAEPLPNMPTGNPDLSLGIVVRENSTGRDVLADSSENIRFTAMKNFKKTEIMRLSSSSMVDRAPKKFTFIDKKHGFASDHIYEFSITFSNENDQWDYMRFMPFCSVIEWATEEKMKFYLDQWVQIFENAGWTRVKRPKSNNPSHMQDFTLPTAKNNGPNYEYCVWTTKEYKAIINVTMRDSDHYKNFVPKAQRKNITNIPNGYISFITISKKSQFPNIYGATKEKDILQ